MSFFVVAVPFYLVKVIVVTKTNKINKCFWIRMMFLLSKKSSAIVIPVGFFFK